MYSFVPLRGCWNKYKKRWWWWLWRWWWWWSKHKIQLIILLFNVKVDTWAIKNSTWWRWAQSCLPDDDCQIEDGVTGYWWRHATITEIDLTNQFLSYFSILSTFIIIQSIFSMLHFEVVNYTLKYLNIKVGSLIETFGAVKFVEARTLCHIFFCFQQNWKQNTLHLWHKIVEHKIARWGRWGRVIGLAGYRFQRQNWFIWDDIIYWHIPYVFEGRRIQQSWFIDLLSL